VTYFYFFVACAGSARIENVNADVSEHFSLSQHEVAEAELVVVDLLFYSRFYSTCRAPFNEFSVSTGASPQNTTPSN